MIYRIIIICLAWVILPLSGNAQIEKRTLQMVDDTLRVSPAADSIVKSVVVTDSMAHALKKDIAFKPDPKKAVLMALVPGLGQIYNQKYWKLPIVYGGLMGCVYAVTWNNRNYKDYSTAYKDIVLDSRNSSSPDNYKQSWQDFIPVGADPSDWVNKSSFHEQLKRRKDYYRKYRDMSIMITIGVYALSIIDAYVDAQLFDFDISEDLSMHLEPVVSPKTSYSSRSYGLNCSIKF